MVKVITYGTYDLLHYGHIRLLERAKALGDYLIVGVTADDFDKSRGKINVQQSLIERIEAVRATGIADEIIVEEYEGQKIDDIRRLGIDIFTVGSDWVGKFDYLKEYCEVVYLDRTQGVSSSELRTEKRKTAIGVVGEGNRLSKFVKECGYVNGVEVVAACINDEKTARELSFIDYITDDYEKMIERVDAVYIISRPEEHYGQIKTALEKKKHVLCESPITLNKKECEELFAVAKSNDCVLMEAVKTAYATAYSRLTLLAKSGKIGEIVSVDATCTSLRDIEGLKEDEVLKSWNSICDWGPTAMLPIFQLLGTKYNRKSIVTKYYNKKEKYDKFTKIDYIYDKAVASLKVGKNAKSEGELIISGTKGYIYVPAPWWKTDYFELRYENVENNKRYFYQLDGEGIRYEIVAFATAIQNPKTVDGISYDVSVRIASDIEDYYCGKDVIEIN